MKVAVVGSGPAGYYLAEGLLNQPGGAVEVDILDRLPTPYGLVRAGVAPDHQSTKSVIRRFAKLHESPALRFYGNLEVGRDVAVDELQQHYDAVVLATGAASDRGLGIPGESLAGVHGAAEFVGWYNAHPDFVGFDPDLDTRAAVIIGNGNVAIDVARVLAKTPAEMSTSDLPPHAAARIHASPLREFHIVGRRGPLNVGFTAKELGELGELAAAVATADPEQMPSPEAAAAADPAFGRVLKIMQGYSTAAPDPGRKRIHLEFFARPVRILGNDRVTSVQFERTVVEGGESRGTGEFFERECGLVVSCIGYRTQPVPGVPYDAARGVHRNVDMLVERGLYCTGWSARGPSGTIGSNRKEGFALAARIAAQTREPGKRGRAGLESLAAARGIELVNFAAWQRIDAAEIAAAATGAPRRKFEYVADMLATARAATTAT
jgi:adrenodoxin-NADP+ reductase